jgi:chromosome partitioning protein
LAGAAARRFAGNQRRGGLRGGHPQRPRSTEVLVIDAPARVHGAELNELVRRAETIIVPVLPSSVDMKACSRFMADLLEIGKVSRKQARLAVIANRVREQTLDLRGARSIPHASSRCPYLGSLREAQNYVRAYARGMGVLELPEYLAWPDWKQWEPITEWLGEQAQPAFRVSCASALRTAC